jgi:hypothetical protein
MSDTELTKLAAALNPIVETQRASTKARREVRDAKRELVGSIIEMMTAAVPALGDRPAISNDWAFTRGLTFATWRAIALSCDTVDKARPLVCKEHGLSSISGTHLFLDEDGRIVALSYTGGFQAGPSWVANESTLKLDAFCDLPASDPDMLIARMAKLAESAGDRSRAVEDMQGTATRYRAISAALQRPSR